MTNDAQKPKHDNNEVEEKQSLPSDCQELEKERNEYKNSYLRALADYQNLEKRVSEERQAIRTSSQSEIIIRLLPFLDNLEKAEVFIKDQGLQMTKKQFELTLSEMGVKEIDVLGKEFDPHFAEAIEVIEGKQDNIIVEVLKKGYQYKDKVIRVAQVKVSKKNEV